MKKVEIIVKILVDADPSSKELQILEQDPETVRRVFEEGMRKENGKDTSVLSMRVVNVC